MLKKPILLLCLACLCIPVFPNPSCYLSPEFPIVSPGTTLNIEVRYQDFPFASPIAVVCRPNSIKFCFTASGSGTCQLTCEYPYKGIYTLSAASSLSQCATALVVVDPKVKPSCVITADKETGNGTLTSFVTVRFNNLLPNSTEAVADCGNGAPPFSINITKNSVSFICQYRAEVRKEVFNPKASSGGAICRTAVSVIPSSDSEPPLVSLYNLTNRLAINNSHNILINATDNVEIDRVELLINGIVVSVMKTKPYSYMLDVRGYPNDTEFQLRAIAYDIYGNSNSTYTYTVYSTVSGQRSCNLTASPRYSPIPAVINLTAYFYNTSSDVLFAYMQPHWPYSTYNKSGASIPIINKTARGTVQYSSPGVFTAYATDGNVSCTTKVYITATKDTTPPTVKLTAPINYQNIYIPDVIELKASASDNVLVDNVSYYLGDRLIATSFESPFNATWNTSGEKIGFYDLQAIAYDIAGNPSIIPSKAQVILYTNRTCFITPDHAVVVSKKPVIFSVSCFNYTATNFSQEVTNRTVINGTENFTISTKDITKTVFTTIPCPEMDWSSTMWRSQIIPTKSSSNITFIPQEASLEISGVLTATDPTTGFSCSSRVMIFNETPGCRVTFDSPVIVGSEAQINISYENLTRPQEFRIVCRPNFVTGCSAEAGTGSCLAQCPYPITGRFSVSASSPYISCASKNISVLPHPDILPPTISITRPFNRQIITGVFVVEAYATDNFGVSKVEFYLDSSLVSTDEKSSPYTFLFNTTTMRNGEHTISARAYDETGNTRTHSITVIVAN